MNDRRSWWHTPTFSPLELVVELVVTAGLVLVIGRIA